MGIFLREGALVSLVTNTHDSMQGMIFHCFYFNRVYIIDKFNVFSYKYIYLKSLKLCKLIITSLILCDWCLKTLKAKARPLGSNAIFVLSVPTKCQNYNVILCGGPSYSLCVLCDSRDFIIMISVNLSGKKKPKIWIKNIAVNWDLFPSPSTDTAVSSSWCLVCDSPLSMSLPCFACSLGFSLGISWKSGETNEWEKWERERCSNETGFRHLPYTRLRSIKQTKQFHCNWQHLLACTIIQISFEVKISIFLEIRAKVAHTGLLRRCSF